MIGNGAIVSHTGHPVFFMFPTDDRSGPKPAEALKVGCLTYF